MAPERQCLSSELTDAGTCYQSYSLQVFDPEDECPKDHVKITGASLCMKKRDLCKKCSDITPMTLADCPNGKIVAEKDCNGCKIEK